MAQVKPYKLSGGALTQLDSTDDLTFNNLTLTGTGYIPLVAASASNSTALVIRGATSQSVDILQIQDSAYNVYIQVSYNGWATFNKGFSVIGPGAGSYCFTARLASGSTSPIIGIMNASGSEITKFDYLGNLYFDSSTSQVVGWPNFTLGQTSTSALTMKFGSNIIQEFTSSQFNTYVATAYRPLSDATASITTVNSPALALQYKYWNGSSSMLSNGYSLQTVPQSANNAVGDLVFKANTTTEVIRLSATVSTPLIQVTGPSGLSNDFFNIKTSGGTSVASLGSNGAFYLYCQDPAATFFNIKAAANQTANCFIIRDGSNNTLMAVDASGNLNFGGTGHYITNMLDPSNPQDAATKNYVDTQIASVGGGGTNFQNYLMNGNFWNNDRNGALIDSTNYAISVNGSKNFIFPRWYAYTFTGGSAHNISRYPWNDGSTPSTNRQHERYVVRILRDSAATGTGSTCIVQEIDRDIVRMLRGRSLKFSCWCSPGMYTPSGYFSLRVITYNGTETASWYSTYSGTGTGITYIGDASWSVGGTSWTKYTCSTSSVPTDATCMAVVIRRTSLSSTASLTDGIWIAEAMLYDSAATAPSNFTYFGGDISTEQTAIMRYWERSYGPNRQYGYASSEDSTSFFYPAAYTLPTGSLLGTDIRFRVPKRAVPSNIYLYAPNGSSGQWYYGSGNFNITWDSTQAPTVNQFRLSNNSGATRAIAAGQALSGHWIADAEL